MRRAFGVGRKGEEIRDSLPRPLQTSREQGWRFRRWRDLCRALSGHINSKRVGEVDFVFLFLQDDLAQIAPSRQLYFAALWIQSPDERDVEAEFLANEHNVATAWIKNPAGTIPMPGYVWRA